jgi:adenine deaminase
VAPGAFRHTGGGDAQPVIGVVEGRIITEHLTEAVAPGPDGDRAPDTARDLIRIAVVERHGVHGGIATGFVRGFGLKRGAIASTVCHDHHNIAVVGADYADMALAVNRLAAIEGGFVVAAGGEVLAEIALPVAGLMALAPFEAVARDLHALRDAARSLGVTLREPFLQLSFLCLPVIPHLKITDRGMVDVDRFALIDG